MATSAMSIAIRPPIHFPSSTGSTGRRSSPCGNLRRRSTILFSSASGGGGKTRIHRLIEEQGTVLIPGCYDALSAAIVQRSGFSAGFISGYALSASLLGKPDFGLLTPPEMAETARFVCPAAPMIPIIADADTGGGNALNVQRTIHDLIAAGAAGCFLEDQAWPKKCGHMRGKQVIPAEEHAAKIASARDAIGDADFFLVARTDARATSAKSGLSDAISRANLYMEELNDKKRLATSGANFARAFTVEFGTCKFPYNFTGCQDLAKQKKVPFISDDLEIECEGKEKYKCGSNVFWKW